MLDNKPAWTVLARLPRERNFQTNEGRLLTEQRMPIGHCSLGDGIWSVGEDSLALVPPHAMLAVLVTSDFVRVDS